MQNSQKLCAVLLSLAMLLPLTACGGGGSGETADTQAAVGETQTVETRPAETEPEFEADSLPATMDFKGETLTALYRTDVVDSFYAEQDTGDVVNDAVHAANVATEERLNLKFAVKTQAGSANADRSVYVNAIANSVMSGDDAYQLCGVLTYNIPDLIQKGCLLDLLKVEHLDFEKPWWVGDLTELATIGGRLYFAAGDISLELTQRLFCMVFNKDLMDDLGLPSMYDIVREGKWTMDKAMEIAEAATSDANGDGELNEGDVYGMVVNDSNHTCGFIGSLGMTVTSLDKDGRNHLDFATEHDVNVVQVVTKLLAETKGVFYQNTSDAGDNSPAAQYREMFMADKIAVLSSEFYQISSVFREMDSEFGVVPYPKFDENQKDYQSVARNVYSSFVVPTTAKNTEMVGAFMEALASENYRTTSRTYFETALKVKYARDNDSSQMYDIIKDGMRFDFGYTFNGVEKNIVNAFMDVVKSTGQEWTSYYAGKRDAAEAQLQAFYDTVLAFD